MRLLPDSPIRIKSLLKTALIRNFLNCRGMLFTYSEKSTDTPALVLIKDNAKNATWKGFVEFLLQRFRN